MSRLVWAAALLAAMTATSVAADWRGEPRYASGIEQFTYSFAAMPLLPRRLQNHCTLFNGHFVCADHCGNDYQVFYCGRYTTGCCHIGRGYCDASGALRCLPALF